MEEVVHLHMSELKCTQHRRSRLVAINRVGLICRRHCVYTQQPVQTPYDVTVDELQLSRYLPSVVLLIQNVYPCLTVRGHFTPIYNFQFIACSFGICPYQ